MQVPFHSFILAIHLSIYLSIYLFIHPSFFISTPDSKLSISFSSSLYKAPATNERGVSNVGSAILAMFESSFSSHSHSYSSQLQLLLLCMRNNANIGNTATDSTCAMASLSHSLALVHSLTLWLWPTSVCYCRTNL